MLVIMQFKIWFLFVSFRSYIPAKSLPCRRGYISILFWH
uniref:Uncharacterized protein n=1 Tax=Rhizophora mucronata TaxID=61149 RepID=A0A2P2NIR4_RHIMU